MISQLNLFRLRAVRTSRRWKMLFLKDGQLSQAASHVLADLRNFAFVEKGLFDKDPLVMARREGRREVFLRIKDFLSLDEAQVQLLMEIDDGNE